MFSCLNCNTVNIKRVTGFDSYGEPTISKTETVKCKLEYSIKNMADRNGDVATSTGSIRCTKQIGEWDLVEVAGTYKDFIQVQPQTDFGGNIVYWIGWF